MPLKYDIYFSVVRDFQDSRMLSESVVGLLLRFDELYDLIC